MDGVVRDLVGEVNFIALHNEASGLDEGLPPDLPAIDWLSEVRAPALILVGNSNQLRTLAAADLLASELPNARKVVMTGAARLRNMERPKKQPTLAGLPGERGIKGMPPFATKVWSTRSGLRRSRSVQSAAARPGRGPGRV